MFSGILPYASIVVLLKAQAKKLNSTRQTPPKPKPITPNYPQPKVMIEFTFLHTTLWALKSSSFMTEGAGSRPSKAHPKLQHTSCAPLIHYALLSRSHHRLSCVTAYCVDSPEARHRMMTSSLPCQVPWCHFTRKERARIQNRPRTNSEVCLPIIGCHHLASDPGESTTNPSSSQTTQFRSTHWGL